MRSTMETGSSRMRDQTRRIVEIRLHEIDHGDRVMVGRETRVREKSRSGSMRSTMETRALPHVSRPCFFVEIRLHEIDHGDKGASTTTSTSTRVEIRLHEIDHGDLVKVAAACRTATVSRSGSMRSTMETGPSAWGRRQLGTSRSGSMRSTMETAARSSVA